MRNIPKTFNDKSITEIYNLQNTKGSAINAQVYQPILELQAKLNAISENIANQQTSLNKIPQALNYKLNRLDSVIYKVNNIHIDKCSQETICINTDTIKTINNFSNYVQNDISQYAKTTSASEKSQRITNNIFNNINIDYKFWITVIITLIGIIISYSTMISSNESAKKLKNTIKVLDKIEYSLDQQNNKVSNKK